MSFCLRGLRRKVGGGGFRRGGCRGRAGDCVFGCYAGLRRCLISAAVFTVLGGSYSNGAGGKEEG